jgi:plastocyanin
VEPVWNAIESVWQWILDLTAQFVMPDWGVLVGLIPVLLALLVALALLWLINRWATAGPKERGPRRRTPVTPADVHMPGPSLAPFLAAAGAFLLFMGLLLGGPALWFAIGFLVLALLYWLREATREYDRLEPASSDLPVVASDGPPAGVHVPGPSFRPLLVSLAAFVMFAGLVYGTAVLVVGVILLVLALVGWLRDARREYVLTEEADQTGHLRNAPEARFPSRAIAVGAIVVVAAFAVQSGVFSPTGSASGDSGSPAPSGAPASGEPAASAGTSAGASAAPSEVAADVTITAQGIAYTESEVTAPADKPFTIAFHNMDAGVPHNVAIHEGSPSGQELFKGDIFNGVATKVYDVPALPAGTYAFVCSVHPNMTGTLVVK